MKFLHRLRIWTFALSLITVTGCIREDMSQCDLFLQFRYDYNMTSKCLFAQQVEEVKVYVFGTDGRYLATLSERSAALRENGYLMKVPREFHGCTIITWAGLTDQFYTLPVLKTGDPMEKLTLKYSPVDQTSLLAIDNLWHSGPSTLLFPDDYETTQTVSLVRNTNDFYIRLNDKQGTPITTNYTLQITSADGVYTHKNEHRPDNPFINYRPHCCVQDTLQVRTLRLIENKQAMLTILDSNNKPIDIGGSPQLDLISYVLKTTPQGMGYQEYLDRRYQWYITFTIDQGKLMALCITINNWVQWFHPSDI